MDDIVMFLWNYYVDCILWYDIIVYILNENVIKCFIRLRERDFV